MPYPGLLHPELLPLQQSTADPYLRRRQSHTVLVQSLWGLWVLCAQGLFETSECLWWVWGLILNVILPLLLSCWGFSFAFGSGVSFSFFGVIQHSPVDGCSAASCNFGVLAGEDECTSFYSTVFEDNPVEKEKLRTGEFLAERDAIAAVCFEYHSSTQSVLTSGPSV